MRGFLLSSLIKSVSIFQEDYDLGDLLDHACAHNSGVSLSSVSSGWAFYHSRPCHLVMEYNAHLSVVPVSL